MIVNIRQERPSDYAEVYRLVKTAFATVPDGDGTEPDYLNGLRTQDSFIPELSLVAADDSGRLIGQVVLYKTIITTAGGDITELLLSPLCVHPDCFRRGIARALIAEAFRIALSMGYTAVFLCGDPAFYRKLGFRPTYEFGIFHVEDASHTAEWSLVYVLADGALDDIHGTIDTI